MHETSGGRNFFRLKLTERQKILLRFFPVLLVVLAVAWGTTQLLGMWQTETSFQHKNTKRLAAIRVTELDQWQRTIQYTGNVQAKRQTLASFQRAGKVLELFVDEGDVVSEGQLLAKLDNRHLSAQKLSLAARLAQARSVLDELVAGPRKEKIQAAQSTVVDLNQQLKAQQLKTARSERLVRGNAIAEQDYEQELYQLAGLQAKLDSAQSQLDELIAGTRAEQIAAQQAVIKGIEAEIQLIGYELEDCRLTAPFAGMVVSRKIDEGAVISPGTPVFDLIDHQNLEVHVGLPHRIAGDVVIGTVHPVHIGNLQTSATIRTALAIVDEKTRTQKVVLDLQSSGSSQIVAGQLAKVEFLEQVKETGFWIPASAITSDQRGLWSCYSIQVDDSAPARGMVVKHAVQVIYQQADRVFVRGTLRDGQLLVRDGVHRIVAGETVTFDLVREAAGVRSPVPDRSEDR